MLHSRILPHVPAAPVALSPLVVLLAQKDGAITRRPAGDRPEAWSGTSVPRLRQQLLDPAHALDQVLVAEGVRQPQVTGVPKASPGTTATSASSRISAASSTVSFGRLPRISLPISAFTDGYA